MTLWDKIKTMHKRTPKPLKLGNPYPTPGTEVIMNGRRYYLTAVQTTHTLSDQGGGSVTLTFVPADYYDETHSI